MFISEPTSIRNLVSGGAVNLAPESKNECKVALFDSTIVGAVGTPSLRTAISEVALGAAKYWVHYEASSFGMGPRSLSTWVAVGDVLSLSRAISSQLPSPQGRPTSVHVDNALNYPPGTATPPRIQRGRPVPRLRS